MRQEPGLDVAILPRRLTQLREGHDAIERAETGDGHTDRRRDRREERVGRGVGGVADIHHRLTRARAALECQALARAHRHRHIHAAPSLERPVEAVVAGRLDLIVSDAELGRRDVVQTGHRRSRRPPADASRRAR